MKSCFQLCFFTVALTMATAVHADEFKTVLFADEFDDGELDKLWKNWKSESVERDGVLVGITPEDADHPSVNAIDFSPRADLEISVAFQFKGSPSFSVMIRDMQYKGSHAGHICHVAITPKRVSLYDGKTGLFRKDIRDRRKAGEKLDAETQALLKQKTSRNDLKLDPDAWHDLRIHIEGKVMKVHIDGELVEQLQSDGILVRWSFHQ